ncbi:MAG: glycosyltransferase [Lachnospiraceae bacterium]|nr:glycosyltransferase [Lachnospiraceae bacterium]
MAAKFTVLIRTFGTNLSYYRDCLESLNALSFENWELIILDETNSQEVEWLTEEMFPEENRVVYRKIKHKHGFAYAYNIGVHFASGDYIILLGQHDRLSGNTLEALNKKVKDYEIVYSDHDELIESNRMHPHFKPDYNEELLRHGPYIGSFLCFRKNLCMKMGEFHEKLEYYPMYDFLFRCVEAKIQVGHIPALLYHERVVDEMIPKERKEKMLREYATIVLAHIRRKGLDASVVPEKKNRFLDVEYKADFYKNHRNEYLFLHEKGVRIRGKKYMQKLYSVLSQPDVGVVGIRFLHYDFTNDNCGYIYGNEGIAYPACYNKSVFSTGYENRAIIPADVSMVDAGCCMIDAKLYRHIGGFGANLDGRDIMLDFCLKARDAGRRVVYLPDVVAYRKIGNTISTQSSNGLIMERWHDKLKAGDPFYNENLPLGLDNYELY